MGGRHRHQYAVLAMLVTAAHYIVRQNLNFAIIEIANAPQNEFEAVCKAPDLLEVSVNVTSPEVLEAHLTSSPTPKANWTAKQYGTMLGAFYYGYCAAMIPGALLAQRFGFYPVIIGVTMVNGFATFLYPMAVHFSYNLAVAMRIILGLSSGPIMPALQGSWHWWSLKEELTVAIAVQTAGITIGNCVGALGTGFLINNFNWQMSFYVSGLFMIFIGILWTLLVSPLPEMEINPADNSMLSRLKISHRMSAKEKTLIVNSRGTQAKTIGLADVPWGKILKSYKLGTLAMVWFAMSYMIYNATNNLPTYLKRVHEMSISQIGNVFGLVAVVTMIVNIGVACMADRMRKVMKTTSVRKLLAGLLSLIFVPCSLYINGLHCDRVTILVCIAVYIMFASSVSTISLKPITAEMAGKYATVVFGFVNSFGNIAGFVAPRVMGSMLEGQNQGDPESWKMVFAIPACIFTVTMAIFLAFGTSELQPWAMDEPIVPHSSNREETMLTMLEESTLLTNGYSKNVMEETSLINNHLKQSLHV